MTFIIGIDPGPTPGVVGLNFRPGERSLIAAIGVVQCNAMSLEAVLDGFRTTWQQPHQLAIEVFVVGRRAGRSRTPAAGAETRAQITECLMWANAHNVPVVTRMAFEAKAWATDERLDAAGLLEPTRGMIHARDAARHVLFAAVKDFGVPDPLSKRSAS